MAGVIHALGEDVAKTGEFRIGDRVAAFHPMLTAGGAYAEYAAAPAHTVFELPVSTSFEGTSFPSQAVNRRDQDEYLTILTLFCPPEAATIPLVSLTAAISLYHMQSLPPPWSPRSSSAPPIPLIIYGASSALGSFAVKLAKASNIHPIIAICGGSTAYVSTLLDPAQGDAIVDYRQGVEAMKRFVAKALGSLQAKHALDCISAKGSWIPIAQMLESGGQLSVVSGANAYDEVEIPEGVEVKYTYVGAAHSGAYKTGMPRQPTDKTLVGSTPEFASVFYRYVARMLARGRFEGHPYVVVPGGLDGVKDGLQRLKDGESKGRKFVYVIAETKGLA